MLDATAPSQYRMGARASRPWLSGGRLMQSDGFTRVVLVLILGCLVALVAGQYGLAEASSAATRGRYSITLVRQANDFTVLRTDTHEGVISRTLLKDGGPWEVLGANPLEVSPEPATR